jgi:hypothetical protein
MALRCRLLLLAQQGVANHAIAQELNVSRTTPGEDFDCGVGAEDPDTTLQSRPDDRSTHLTVRMLAQHLGGGAHNRAPCLAPSRCAAASRRTLQGVQDPRFEEKVQISSVYT